MQCLPQRGLEFHNEKLPPFQGPPTVPRGCFIPPCGWSFILEVNSSSTEFAGQAGQNWTFMSWYWAKSHLSNMDSGLIVLQHAVPSTKRSGISQRETASISGSSDSATWMFHSTMWMVFHLGSQFLLDGICRPSWSKLNFHELILGKITSFKHGFRSDSSSTCSAFHKEVWNFTTRNCLHFRVLRQCHVDVSFHHVDGLSSWKSIPPRRNLQAKLVKTELSWVDTGQNHIFQTWIQVW